MEIQSLLLKPGLRRLWETAAFLIIVSLTLIGTSLKAEPPAKTKAKESGPARARIIESANGWLHVNGEWVHPEGYKLVNNKVIRTIAKTGRAFPKPPGKLALENPGTLESRTKTGPSSTANDTRTPAEKAAEARQKNLTPTAAPQTGTHL
ncbi:MAG: hypothetical protein WAO00_15860 [Chthoniobacterales bacterium]